MVPLRMDSAPTGRASRVVALRVPRGPGALEALDAVWAAGDAVLPLPALDVDAGADAVVDPSEVAGTSAVPSGTALVIPTSGTTGKPRGVVLSHAALDAAVQGGTDRVGGTGDRWLCCLPLEHVAGLLVLLRARASGTPATVLPRFDTRAVADALSSATPPTHVSLVPTMLHRLLEDEVDVARFRCILLGGAAAPPGLLDRARARGGCVVTTYGMTETCGGVVYDGVPLEGVGAAVDPDGRILLSGPTLATGYVGGSPPAVRPLAVPGGWFATPDHGRWDADGRLEVLGRLDDVVVSGGENVDTSEVRRLLEAEAGVTAAAVTGVPDAEWGHRIEAWVVTDLPLVGVATLLRGVLPPPAVPKRLHRVAQLPRSALGKVARARLTDLPVMESWPQTFGTPGPQTPGPQTPGPQTAGPTYDEG